MHYYIDGYNLLFRNSDAKDELRKHRESLLEYLNRSIHLIGLDATLVFDSHYREGEATTSHLIDLEVVFTAEGETADDFIVQALENRQSTGIQMVVTSDKKLAWRARRSGALTQTSEDFLLWLQRRVSNKLKRPHKKTSFIPPAAPSQQPRCKEPQKTSSVEECVDYYQAAFEKSYHEIQEKEAAKPKKKSSLSKKKKAAPKDDLPLLSDYDRWLEIFEKNSDKD